MSSPKGKIPIYESIVKSLSVSILFIQLACMFISNKFIFGETATTTTSLGSFTPPIPNINVGTNQKMISPNRIKSKDFLFLMPHIDTLVDHAEFAMNSYLSEAEILKTLRRTKTRVRIIQRILEPVGS